MKKISGFEDYKVLAKNRNSRYALLRDKKTYKIVIADIVDFKILYEFKARRCNYSYVRPKTIFVSIPRIEYLESNKYFADVFFLNDFSKGKFGGIVVLEDGILSIFNSEEGSMVKIEDIKRVVISMCHSLHEVGQNLVSGYELKLEFLNINKKLQELDIEISNREDIREIGGVSIENIISFKNNDFLYLADKKRINIANDKRRIIELDKLPDFSSFKDIKFVKERGLCNIVSLWHYMLLR